MLAGQIVPSSFGETDPIMAVTVFSNRNSLSERIFVNEEIKARFDESKETDKSFADGNARINKKIKSQFDHSEKDLKEYANDPDGLGKYMI